MSKTDLKTNEEPKTKIFTWRQVKTLEKLSALVHEHGVIFIAVKDNLPLKITQAELK
jgi:hypothetical protein